MRWDDEPDYEDLPPRRSSRCQCFAPGECSGSCPGPDNCPMCETDEEEQDDDEE